MIVWSVETLIASTLLMLLVLLLRGPVRRSFGPNVAYALWLLPAARMILPPLPPSWRGSALPVLPAVEDITIYVGQPIAVLRAEPAHGIGWPTVVIALWFVGAAGFALYHLIAHRRFCDRVRRGARSVSLVANGRVQVIETDAAQGPLAFGVWRKYVAFPRDFADRFDRLERDLALAHELGHHARGDLLANWAALLVLAVHWFNPIAWRAFRAFRADQEMACDALVLAGRAPGLRHAYGRAIVKSAHGGAVSAACHLHTVNEIKSRLKMLSVHEKMSWPRLALGTGALGALALGCLGVTASGTQAAERVRTGVESATGVDIADIVLPPLPHGIVPPPPPPPAEAHPAKPPRTVRIIRRDRDGTVTETVREGDGRAVTIIDGVPAPRGPGHDDRGPGPEGYLLSSDDDGSTVVRVMPRVPMPPQPLAPPRPLPPIASGDCGRDGAGDVVVRRRDGDSRRTIICVRRDQAAARAAADAGLAGPIEAGRIRRDAMASALDALRSARSSIERDRGMTDAQRASALDGINQAMRRMESKLDD